MSETLIERDGYRVRLVLDDSGNPPYDDGATPVVRHEGWGRATQVTEVGNHELHPQILIAASLWWGEPDKLERYLRIFHGVTSVKWGSVGRGPVEYLTFDPQDWREYVGLTTDPVNTARTYQNLANMDEWLAYCNGEVYGYVIERAETWARLDADGQPTDDRHQEWGHVDSLWGHYGYEWAVQAATEEFEATLAPA